MISICIPVYNHPVVPLASQLVGQAQALGLEAELVCIDDGSSARFRQENAPLAELGTYVTLDSNVGRARIRNLFLQHARGQYMLFLDNDVAVGPDFMARYAAALAPEPGVVVGGVLHTDHGHDDEHALRRLYGRAVESRPAAERARHPHRAFMTGNFMIRRQLLDDIRFDETLNGYGHEDTLFGYRLRQRGVPILHIDNPVLIDEEETNPLFLAKTRQAVANLAVLYRRMEGDVDFCRSVRLLEAYRLLKRLRMEGAVRLVSTLLRRPMESHFEAGTNISVSEFNFYKLGLLCQALHDAAKKNSGGGQ